MNRTVKTLRELGRLDLVPASVPPPMLRTMSPLTFIFDFETLKQQKDTDPDIQIVRRS